MHEPLKQPLAQYRSTALGYGESLVFDSLDLTMRAGRITAFCGPNGCGKSTSLKALRRLLRPSAGDIFLNGESVSLLSNKQLARQMAMLTQAPSAPEELLVQQLVTLGRYAHRRRFAGLTDEDRRAIAFAMSSCALEALADKPLGTLSGGQMQRAWLATILAQDAPVILLDEPTNHLDIKHQIETLELVKTLNREQGRSVVLILHDLNLAARYADDMVLFARGAVHAQGAAEDVMTEATIAAVFGIDCRVIRDPLLGKPMCIPYPVPSARHESN